MLVLAGPAGAEGELELNGARHALPVPGADAAEPSVVKLGPGDAAPVAVVLNEAQAETFAVVEEGVCVGVDPFGWGTGDDERGRRCGATTPVPPVATLRPAGGAADRVARAAPTGPSRQPPRPARAGPRPRSWAPGRARGTAAEVAGTAAGYKPVPAVGPPARFDAAHGDAYGWLTLENPGAAAAREEPTVFPGGAGRLHVFRDGEAAAIVGPGAAPAATRSRSASAAGSPSSPPAACGRWPACPRSWPPA